MANNDETLTPVRNVFPESPLAKKLDADEKKAETTPDSSAERITLKDIVLVFQILGSGALHLGHYFNHLRHPDRFKHPASFQQGLLDCLCCNSDCNNYLLESAAKD
jgi:hypothetical protein